jgi:GNAT superfamily N-acetyltransferase
VKTFHSISTAFRPNRAANSNPTLRDPIPSAHHYFGHHWSGARANSFYLDLLAIDPQYQGKGHGKALVQWGLNQAREEGVCASVVSSAPGYPFYLKMGFVQEVGTVDEGKGNPLKGNVGGWILFTPLPREGEAAEGGDASTAEELELFRAALKSAQTRPQTSASTT